MERERMVARGAKPGTNTLEKKNKDLNKATRELEAKVKNLQQKTTPRTLPRVKSQSRLLRELPTTPKEGGDKEEGRKGSTVTSRIREREAEFRHQVVERDDQISRLKERLKILSSKLTESKEKDTRTPKSSREKERIKQMQNSMEQGTELQNIIKQVTKERLQLERHLQIANDSLQRNNGVDLQKYLSLESTNSHLRSQLDSLDILQQEYRLVEIQHREKEEACKELMNTLKYKSSLVEDLESQLAKVIEKNTELTIQNSDLQKKVVELHHVSDEVAHLKNSLNQMETECVTAKSEVKSLSGKVRNLECVLEEMHKAAENRREIERQHKEALESLKRKQGEVETVATKKQTEIIDKLKIKIFDLETERKVQNEKHQELILEMADLKAYGTDTSLPAEIENPSDNIEIDEIMAKLEQDNKFLADLEKQRAASKNDSPPHRAGSAITDSGFLSQSSLNGNSTSPITRERAVSLNRSTLELPRLSGADKINLLSGSFSASALNNLPGSMGLNTREVIIDNDGMVEIPGKGWCWVYLARYSYDPFQHSPNDTPESELAINAGDYILVWSDPDDDGFFDGEILDGRKGLVPSNFVERLEGEELIEFYKSVVMGIGDGDDSVCTSIPQDLDFISSDEGAEEPNKCFTSRKATLSHYASCTDLDMTEDEGEATAPSNQQFVPAPKHLTLETQPNKSMLVGWNVPEAAPGLISSYQVLVDGEVMATVKAESAESNLKTTVPALVEPAQIHRISVKAIGTNNKSSNEASCTMIVGKDAPLGPTALRATRIRTTSATVSWMPSNTNFLHTLCLNNLEVRTVKQGVFKHTIAGLTPNTIYKVTVRAKNIKAAPYTMERNVTKQLETLSSHVEIRTLPQGLPDPPLDVQVEEGPEPETLTVAWLPVTITPFGLSNGAPVTGYIVYGDGRKLKDIDEPTADSTVVNVTKTTVRTVSMRTKSNDKLSNESSCCPVPDHLVVNQRSSPAKSNTIASPEHDSDSDSELLEKLANHAVLNGGVRPREMVINYGNYTDLDSDVGPSELSDIAEEPEEDDLTDTEDNRVTINKKILVNSNHNNNNNVSNSLYKASKVNVWAEPALALNTSQSSTLKQSSTTLLQSSTTNLQSSTTLLTPDKPLNTTLVIIDNKNNKTEQKINSNLEFSTTQHNRNNERMRIFVALFDYDPPTMSPNPDACDEELPFREGQLIKVVGEKDGDGFYWGEAGGKAGFVPCNMVSEVQVDDASVAEELFREQAGSANTSAKAEKAEEDDRWADIYEDSPVRRKMALYDYDPRELSPNVDSEVELSFRTGEVILIYGEMDDDGFFMGELNGARGLVPSNFLADIPNGMDSKTMLRQVLGSGPRVLGQQRVAAPAARW